MDWIEGCLGSFWRRIEAACSIDQASLGLYRIIWGLFLFLFSTPYSSWIASAPQGLFDPPVLSIAYLFSDFPPKSVWVFSDLFSLLLILMIVLGIQARISALLFVLTSFFTHSFHYSFGKIDHGILLYIITISASFANWGIRYSLVPDRPIAEAISRRSLAVAGVAVAFGMLTAGIPKALFWIDFDTATSAFLHWFYSGYFSLGRSYLAAPFVLSIPEHLFEPLDYLAALFELSAFPMLLWGKRAWTLWLLIASLFHLANGLLLNIPFSTHALVYALFVSYSRHFTLDAIQAKRRLFLWPGLFFLSLLFGIQITFLIQDLPLGLSGLFALYNPDKLDLLHCYLAIAVWIAAIALLLLELRAAFDRRS